MPKNLTIQQTTGDRAAEPGTRGRLRRSAEVSKERILDAALAEFAAHGYDGATTASIARRVGVTQPLIHYHFGSKTALWKAVAARAFDQLSASVSGAVEEAAGGDPLDVMRTLARYVVGFIAKNREFSRLMLTEPAFDSPRLDWLVQEHFRPIFERCARLCEAAQDVELLKKVRPDHVIFAFLGAASVFYDCAPLRKRLYGTDVESAAEVREYADAVVELFARGISLRNRDA